MTVKQSDAKAEKVHESAVTLHGRELTANQRIDLNLDWVDEIQVNTSAVERRAATIGTRRTVKKDW